MKRNRPEVIDQRLVRALAHPLRIKILEALTERVASPIRLSDDLDAGLSHVAYHTRALDKCGCLELVDTAQRRGATEHFYKARPTRSSATGFGGGSPRPARRCLRRHPAELHGPGGGGAGGGHDRRPRGHDAPLDAGPARPARSGTR